MNNYLIVLLCAISADLYSVKKPEHHTTQNQSLPKNGANLVNNQQQQTHTASTNNVTGYNLPMSANTKNSYNNVLPMRCGE